MNNKIAFYGAGNVGATAAHWLANMEIGDCVLFDIFGQVAAGKALETFQRLIRQFPDSLYAQKAKENVIKCQLSLAGHELEVGIFYYKSKQYRAAISRLKTLLKYYPDVGGIHYQALQFLDLSEAALRRQAVAG